MNIPQCPVLSQFIATWNNYLHTSEANAITAPLIPHLQQAKNDAQSGSARRLMSLDWHIHTALPAWLDAAGLTDQAAAVREFPKDVFKHCSAQHEALQLLDSINASLVSDINTLDVHNTPQTSKKIRNASILAVGASGERPALQAAARPYIDYRPWLILTRAESTAPHAAILTALKAHASTRRSDPEPTTEAALAPTVHSVRTSALQLFRDMSLV